MFNTTGIISNIPFSGIITNINTAENQIDQYVNRANVLTIIYLNLVNIKKKKGEKLFISLPKQ